MKFTITDQNFIVYGVIQTEQISLVIDLHTQYDYFKILSNYQCVPERNKNDNPEQIILGQFRYLLN